LPCLVVTVLFLLDALLHVLYESVVVVLQGLESPDHVLEIGDGAFLLEVFDLGPNVLGEFGGGSD
jgi:hypothetical protein